MKHNKSVGMHSSYIARVLASLLSFLDIQDGV